MFGKIARAALYAVAAVLASGILTWVLPKLTSMMMTAGASNDDMLIQSFQAINQNSLFIMLASVLLGLIAGAITESRSGYA